MHGSATVAWLLTAVCAFVACVCLLRAEGAGGMRRRTARSEALMGLGMAAMALPGSVAGALSPLVFLALFGTVGVLELTRFREGLRRAVPASGPDSDPGGGPVSGAGPGTDPEQAEHAHHLHHFVGALAMIYMALAMPGAHGAAGGHGPGGAAVAGVPLLTGALLVYYAGYVLRTGLLLLPDAAGQGHEDRARRDGIAVRRRGGDGDAGVPDGRRVLPVPRDTAGTLDLPGLAPACRLAMATGMLAMLLTL
ncbi:DUF5134 domain-containing protein [Streptomyces marispadix]|uniref:DUF5134 domain-containing protein n=1 Tax=Streptomyces marispadix TaxID=2922868 RepID=A0ABS9SS41_9ACTN|nr:DUF5134 domain-containing protein [Streptomyces marispadix]MCH6159099.1 DUF5134 domain-containing protein [Streptomyces marispadix]